MNHQELLLRGIYLGAVAIWVVACAGRETPPSPVPPLSTRVDSPPVWRPGDRWVYEWTSGKDSGTKTVEVIEIKEVNMIQYYLVKIGDIEHYYTRDLKWSGSVRDGRVESRMVPPQPYFVWPLSVGEHWTHRGSYETREKKTQQNDTFAVVTVETIEVPAGRFHTFKVVREASRTESDEYWYAPEVHWYVRWIGRRGNVRFEERLREYHMTPRLIPESTSGPPSRPG